MSFFKSWLQRINKARQGIPLSYICLWILIGLPLLLLYKFLGLFNTLQFWVTIPYNKLDDLIASKRDLRE